MFKVSIFNIYNMPSIFGRDIDLVLYEKYFRYLDFLRSAAHMRMQHSQLQHACAAAGAVTLDQGHIHGPPALAVPRNAMRQAGAELRPAVSRRCASASGP
jgi:hypothetical protein